MLEGIENIFSDKKEMLRGLKRITFEENTEAFIENYGHYFDEMSEYMGQAADKDAEAKEISTCFVQAVKGAYQNKRGKIKTIIQMDLNLFMIYYVFPIILKRVVSGKMLADNLCEIWNKSFAGADIQYTDYETLYDSFKEKIFGII